MYSQTKDEYDVSQYTDEELLRILDMNNPTDRELEAKIIGLVNKYKSFENETGDRISKFYSDMYRRFFDVSDDDEDEEDRVEGYTNMDSNPAKSNQRLSLSTTGTSINVSGSAPLPSSNMQGVSRGTAQLSVPGGNALTDSLGTVQTFNMGNVLDMTTDNRKSDTTLTKPVDYAKDTLNPLLKQTVRRILSIDSQYRDNRGTTFSTDFTFNLSEPLRDVVALKLYSIGIPYSWYTISRAYGANFFYIKGNSPGIDGGQFDYEVSVPPGNYDAPTLVSTINNDGINFLKNTFTDMSFGNTRVTYNGGTVLSTIQIDMKKVFGESNYYLNFPTWTSTVNQIDASYITIDTYPQLYSIPSYMGFNEQTYNGTSIVSTIIPGLSTSLINTSQVFSVTSANSTFQIIPYVGGNSLSTATTRYDYIPISINLGGSTSISYTRSQLVTLLDTALNTNVSLDSNYSGVIFRDISGNDKSYNQSSYMELQLKMNPKIMPMVNDLKLAVAFPDNSNNQIFYGDSSCFRFSDKYERWTDPSTNIAYYVNELSDIYSEVPILQSNYNPGNSNVIKFVCTASGYDLSINNYDIPMSTTAQFSIDNYLSFINTNIQSVSAGTYNNELYGSSGTQTQIIQDTSSNIIFEVHVKKLFTTADYTVLATGEILKLFNMDTSGASNIVVINDKYGVYDKVMDPSSTTTDVSKNTFNLSNVRTFSNPGLDFTSVSFDASSTLIIYPKASVAGIKNAQPFVVNFISGETFNNIQKLVSFLNNKLTNSKFDIQIKNTNNPIKYSTKTPFYNSSVTYDTINGFSLTLNINTELTQDDYKLDFSSANNIRTDLSFNSSYNLIDSSSQSLVAKVKNNAAIPDYLIDIIDGSNNEFTFYPYSTIVGLQTANNIYKVTVTLPSGSYNIKTIHDAINAQLDANPITKGTVFSTYKKADSYTYTKIRMNINKVFSTQDFRLVFYDPYSFATCTSGSTKSIQNVTWDTTIGWILGFREKIIYYLQDYLGFSYSYNTNLQQYYLTDSQSNVCTLIGDTVTNTQLYNYFLIVLDDYVQNHLNDGLVKITNQETNLAPEPHIMVCDPITNILVARPANFGSPGITYTEKQLYAFNQKVDSQLAKINSYSKGPFVKDIFGFIPLKPGSNGSTYSEFGGTLQNQDRMYFGPVNIHRMTIRLLNDRGDLVDLNNNDWNFSLVCEQLYRNSTNI